MDVIALFGTLMAMAIASAGAFVVGTLILVVVLVLLAIYADRVPKRRMLLPFSYASWFLVLPVGLGATYVLDSPFYLGLALYYYGCICLVERKVRWGSGYITLRVQRPFVYWLVVALIFTLSAPFLIGTLHVAARGP